MFFFIPEIDVITTFRLILILALILPLSCTCADLYVQQLGGIEHPTEQDEEQARKCLEAENSILKVIESSG